MPEERQKGCRSFDSNGVRAGDGSNPSTLADILNKQGSNYSSPACFAFSAKRRNQENHGIWSIEAIRKSLLEIFIYVIVGLDPTIH
jgi:hypothetical protein